MGVPEIIAGVGLLVSAASTGYSIYSSDKAAEEAEDIADANARREAMEAEEMAQRAEKDAAREEALARARAAASGVEGESQDLYLKDLTQTNRRDIDWIRSSGASQAALTRREGRTAASTVRREGVAAGIAGLGQAANAAGSWYSARPASAPQKTSYQATNPTWYGHRW